MTDAVGSPAGLKESAGRGVQGVSRRKGLVHIVVLAVARSLWGNLLG